MRSYYQRLSAVVNNSIFIFDICSELQIIRAILRKMESDGPSEVLIDGIVDHFFICSNGHHESIFSCVKKSMSLQL